VLGSLGVPQSIPVVTGIAAHVAWMIVWGVIFAIAADRKPTRTVVVFAIAIGVAAALIARTVIPAAMGAVRFAALPGAQGMLCLALMSAGLLTGRALSSPD
jgi:hypothetical protein